MSSSPRVSIVMPLFNDEEFVAKALKSCLAQTLTDIEIICVDDSSTDATVEIVEETRRKDARIRLIRQPENRSAFQARRVGIEAATAPYILFLDGDDELAPNAASVTLRKAASAKADVVGFGVDIVTADSRAPRRFEAALQPKFGELSAPNIIPALFPVGEEANGHLWRYLFERSLLTKAYEDVDPHLSFYRANDLPITFLALANATRYVSTGERLYRYHFRRGTSGHVTESVERFAFLLNGVDPITSIASQVEEVAAKSPDPETLQRCYQSARLHLIASVLRSCVRETSGSLQRSCLALLEARVGKLDLIRAAVAFCGEALGPLSLATEGPLDSTSDRRSVLLHTAHLDTGGLQSVLLAQAAALSAAGYKVTIAVLRHTTREIDLPAGVTIELVGGDALDRVNRWLEICRDHSVDVIIDHHILYNENWAWRALAALSVGIPTIGWIHNFALRPIFDANQRTSFLTAHLRLLLRVVTLSPSDVAFWKLRGVDNVVYLPNPLSPLALDALRTAHERPYPLGRVELVWWGRLDGPTKQVLDLVATARELKARGVDFRLRIIGPDSKNLTADSVRRAISGHGVDEHVELLGERTALELATLLADAHALMSTSAIEGSPLTLLEAQAFGLPIVMYDLPWLTTAQHNGGMIRTPPNSPVALADAIRDAFRNTERYQELSNAARDFARTAAAVDVDALTIALLNDTLPALYSPDPTLADSRLLIDWLVRFSEMNYQKDSGISNNGAMRRELDRTRRRLEQISEGPSFRVGRVITYLPRKMSEAIRRLRAR
ncbi:glycosyltransferase [Microbacterium foliorum]|uniref:Glycosyltransferase n=1 Tax=Microbacterium foliorum TaxID=104336 RepID=A0A4Y5YTT8_9MICO|nr:glycosyltransferase [Microbacterium foliorum]QDE35759.1 glycosyltransferase [Microbacterium foliorum]